MSIPQELIAISVVKTPGRRASPDVGMPHNPFIVYQLLIWQLLVCFFVIRFLFKSHSVIVYCMLLDWHVDIKNLFPCYWYNFTSYIFVHFEDGCNKMYVMCNYIYTYIYVYGKYWCIECFGCYCSVFQDCPWLFSIR